jgi:hypothetical protein
MGAGATTPIPSSRSQKIPQLEEQKQQLLIDGSSLRRMKESGLNEHQIYQNMRENYGSLRVQKNLLVTDHTIRGLALINLSHTLESNRVIYPTPKPFPFNSITESPNTTTQSPSLVSSLAPSQVFSSSSSPTRSSSQYLSQKSEIITTTGTNAPLPYSSSSSSASMTASTTTTPMGSRKKPNLKIIISLEQEDPLDDTTTAAGTSARASAHASARTSSRGGCGGGGTSARGSLDMNEFGNSQKTPRDRARISPSGALHVGELAICENGIQTTGYFEQRQAIGFLTSGRSDFVIIGSLGRGASGSVFEALHLPTLTLVALKLLPISNAENLHQIASELEVLYRNLAELKLIDERLEESERPFMVTPVVAAAPTVVETVTQTSTTSQEGSMAVKSLCPQMLAMYDGRSLSFESPLASPPPSSSS